MSPLILVKGILPVTYFIITTFNTLLMDGVVFKKLESTACVARQCLTNVLIVIAFLDKRRIYSCHPISSSEAYIR